MHIITGSNNIVPTFGPCTVGIGVFDGVHLGHRALLSEVVATATRENVRSCAYTFDPHPAHLINPTKKTLLIEPLEARLGHLMALGIDTTLVEPFSETFAAMSAQNFVHDIVVGKLKARHVFVGEGFTFGKQCQGTVEYLRAWGKGLGFVVHTTDLQQVEGMTVSSTAVRRKVAEGDMVVAAKLLGHPFALEGLVVRGAGRGQRLGFATANVATPNELLPAVGIYAAYATLQSGRYPAVVNVGYSPTFSVGTLRVEAHLLTYPGGNLYSTSMGLEFVLRLRDEKHFSSAQELCEQMRYDVAAAREVLKVP